MKKMMFCPKCGSLLKTKLDRGKTIMYCSCGYTSKELDNVEIKEKVNVKTKEIEIVEQDIEAYPIVDVECDKCKNKKAYFWLVQTRAGDEAETKFFKCTKCKHTWRDYD
jgi:DNA-directed RNA polymerase subunit M